jgi:ABC-type phosphate/phosphonate transport system substrate-binding protein
MKSRRCTCVFIAATFVGTSSFSQILNGKYVFKNDTCITGYSTHIFKDTELADVRAASSVMLQQILNDWSVNLNSKVAIYDNIDALKKDILEKKIDIFALTTPEYFLLKDQVNATPFLTYKLSDRITDRMILVSRNDSRIRSILELKRRKIAVYTNLTDEFNLPSLWLTTLILKSGGNYQDDYASTIYKVQKGVTAILDVFFRKADAVVVPERDFDISKEMNPQIGTQLSIIDSSKQLLYSVLCYTEKLTTGLNQYKDRDLQSVADMMCNANTTAKGKQLLSIFRITSFIPFKSEYLKETEALFNDFRALSANHNRRLR